MKAARRADHIAPVVHKIILATYIATHDHYIADHIRSALKLPDNVPEYHIGKLKRCPGGGAGIRPLNDIANSAHLASLTTIRASARAVLNLLSQFDGNCYVYQQIEHIVPKVNTEYDDAKMRFDIKTKHSDAPALPLTHILPTNVPVFLDARITEKLPMNEYPVKVPQSSFAPGTSCTSRWIFLAFSCF
jgi:hypothetical protein